MILRPGSRTPCAPADQVCAIAAASRTRPRLCATKRSLALSRSRCFWPGRSASSARVRLRHFRALCTRFVDDSAEAASAARQASSCATMAAFSRSLGEPELRESTGHGTANGIPAGAAQRGRSRARPDELWRVIRPHLGRDCRSGRPNECPERGAGAAIERAVALPFGSVPCRCRPPRMNGSHSIRIGGLHG